MQKGPGLPRICFLLERFYPTVGGTIEHASTLAEKLIDAGMKVFVVTTEQKAQLARYDQVRGIPVYRIPPSANRPLKKVRLILSALFFFIRMRTHYDIIYVIGYRILGIPAILVTSIFHKRCVLMQTLHGELLGEISNNNSQSVKIYSSSLLVKVCLKLRNLLIKRADIFISVSSDISKEYMAGGIKLENIKHIPHGIDIKRFQPISHEKKLWVRQRLGLPEGKKIVIFVGRLVVYKGVLLLIEVWKKIVSTHPDAFLVLVGPGEDSVVDCENELRLFVNTQALDRSVHFTGAVENVQEYLQASDIFILPSENEMFPLSLLEAMSCGLPVIAAPSGGPKEIVKDGENGIHARGFDELYVALVTLMKDKSLRYSLGQASRATVIERYDKTREIRQYVDLFCSLMESVVVRKTWK